MASIINFENYSTRAAEFLKQFTEVPEMRDEILQELAAAKRQSELSNNDEIEPSVKSEKLNVSFNRGKVASIKKRDETDVKITDLLKIIRGFHDSIGWTSQSVDLKILYKVATRRELQTVFMIRCAECGRYKTIAAKKLRCGTAFRYKFVGYKRHVFFHHKSNAKISKSQ